jgi:putative peptidoglycan lipid II flippase
VISSAFYAIRDTRTPARLAFVRVTLSILVGVALMFPFDSLSVTIGGETRRFGAVGLALGASAGAWIEYVLLRRRLAARLGRSGSTSSSALRIGAAGLAAAGAANAAKFALGSVIPFHPGLVDALLGSEHWATPVVLALGTALAFGVVYLATASALGVGLPLRRSLRR